MLEPKNVNATEVEHEDDDNLINGLHHDHLVHLDGEQRCSLLVRLALEQFLRCRVRSESQSSERVHDDVDPEQLYGGQHGLFLVRSNRRYERNSDSGDVGRDLELQKFADCVVHAAAPHDSFDNRRKVVVHQDDVRRLFRNLRAGDTHGKADVGSLECRSIIGTVAGDANNFANALERFDQNFLVLRRRTGKDLQPSTISTRSACVSCRKTGPSMMIPPLVKMPHCVAIERAVSTLSPVHILTVTPAR